jgi:hypothetical protein
VGDIVAALGNTLVSQLFITVKVNPVVDTLAPGAVKVASTAEVPLTADAGVASTIPIYKEVGLKEVERKDMATPDFVYVHTG